MIRRPRRVVPATLVALLLLAATVLIVVSCVQLLLGQPPLLPFDALAAQGSASRWNGPAVLVGGGVLVLLGVTLLACAWAPGTPNVLPLGGRDARVAAGVTRRSLRQDLNSAAEGVDGISGATTTVTPSRIRSTVRTGLLDTSGLAEQVRTAVGERLTAIALQRSPKIAVRVGRTRSSR